MSNPNKKDTSTNYANFLYEAGILNQTPRSGLRFLGGRRQSIAEHLCRTAYIGYLLSQMEIEKGQKVDIGNVLANCLFHDLGEARALDLDYVSQKYSKSDELQAIKDAVNQLSFGEKIIAAYLETEERSTTEGIIAKDADQLEFVCTLREIAADGNVEAETWIPTIVQRLRSESGKLIADQLLQTNPNEWWKIGVEQSHWLNGSKKLA
jgi:putative hydrolase of HD superfamily